MKAKSNAGWQYPKDFWAILLLAALAGQVAAAAEDDPPRFYIEKITVEAERLSPEIVLSESLLQEGEEYSETQLSEAVHRINRLPFVLLAEFSLRKGGERDRYELVVKVFETRLWFFQTDLTWAFNDPVDRFRFDGEFGDRIRAFGDDFDALVGRRFALGSRSLLFATFGSDDGTFAVGYQRYNLWNRNILFSISLGGEERIGSVSTSEFSLAGRAQLGIPIRGNHAVRVLVGWRESDANPEFGSGLDFEEKEAEIAWIFNSLDDPVLPREGALFEAGLTWSDVDDHQTFFSGGVLTSFDFSDQRLGVVAGASRYWPLVDQQSVSAGFRGFFSEGTGDDQIRDLEASVGHQIFLLRRLEPENWRELRLETQLIGIRRDLSQTSPSLGFHNITEDSWSVRTGLIYRNGWGLFRFTLGYHDREIR